MTQTLSVSDLMASSGVAFGTSGARAVTAMTDRVCYTYARAFLQHMASEGSSAPAPPWRWRGLAPSTPRIMAACAAAVSDAGGVVVDCGFVPSPAVAAHGFALGVPSLMVTGSHIPDDRNGIKFNRADGEVLKPDETAIKAQDVAVDESLFDADGQLLAPPVLDAPVDVGTAYVARYAEFFGARRSRASSWVSTSIRPWGATSWWTWSARWARGGGAGPVGAVHSGRYRSGAPRRCRAGARMVGAARAGRDPVDRWRFRSPAAGR
jgi:phosphomannomutase